MSDNARAMLREWLFQRLDENARDWMTGQLSRLETERGDASLGIAFGLAPRKLGKGMLDLSPAEAAAADGCIAGWKP